MNKDIVDAETTIDALQHISRRDDLVLEDKEKAALLQAMKVVKALDRVSVQAMLLYSEFSKHHDEYSDGLRKGLQCIMATIEENL